MEKPRDIVEYTGTHYKLNQGYPAGEAPKYGHGVASRNKRRRGGEQRTNAMAQIAMASKTRSI